MMKLNNARTTVNFVEAAGNDKRVKRLRKMMRRGIYALDIEAMQSEIATMHTSRAIRQLKASELIAKFQQKFINSALQNQAYRSRTVEIKMQLFKVSDGLERHLKALRSYLRTKYVTAFKAYSNQEARNAALDSVLEKPNDFLLKLKHALAYADILIDDFDKASWALKSVSDAMMTNSEQRHHSI